MATSGTINGTTSNANVLCKITWSASQSVSGNYSDVTANLYYWRDDSGYTTGGTWNGKITINGSATSGSKYVTISYNSNTKVLTATTRVYHNTDGSKSITISATGAISGTTLSSTSCSASVTLTTIPRASSISVGTITLGSAKTITITRASSSFTHTVTYAWYGLSGTLATKTSSTSISWTPDLATFAAKIPSSSSGTGTLTCVTYSGSTKIGSKSISFTAQVPSSEVPTISVATTRVDNSVPSGWGIYVKTKSQCTIAITGTGIHGSTIKSYTVKQGSTQIGNAASVTTPVLDTAGTITYTATVKDSRGKTASTTVSISVVDYTEPTIESVLSQRCLSNGTLNDEGTYVSAKCEYAYSTCNGKNTLTRRAYYRKAGAESWSGGSSFDSGTAVVIGGGNIGLDDAYEVKYEITDAFGVVLQIDGVSTSFSTMDFKKGGKGIAIGKASEQDNVFEVAMQFQPTGGIKHLLLDDGDFDDLTTCNTYGISALSNWSNAPPSQLGGTLEIFPADNTDGIVQRFTEESKTSPVVWVRHYYESAWGDWVRTPVQVTLIDNLSWSSGNQSVSGISKYTMVLVKLSGEATLIPCVISGGYLRGGTSWVNSANNIITYAVSATISGDVLTYINSGYMRHNASSNHGAWTQVAVERIVGL